MARRRSDQFAFFLLGGYDLLAGSLTDFSDKDEAQIVETTPLGTSWAEHAYTGLREVGIEQEGWYDDAAGAVHDALSSGPGGIARTLCYGVEGTATGEEFIGWAGPTSASGGLSEGTGGAIQEHYERILSRGDLTKARASYRLQSGGRVVQGRVLVAGLVTSTSPSGRVDLGAESSNYGTVFTQIISATMAASGAGTPSVLFSLEASTDDITYEAIMNLVSATNGARFGYHKHHDDDNRGPRRYFRIGQTPTAVSGSTYSINCMFGLGTSTA